MSMSAVPKRNLLTSVSPSDWSLTSPARAPMIPKPMGKSIAVVAVLDTNAESSAAIMPKPTITP